MELEPCCIYLKFCTQKFHNFFMYCVVNRTVVELGTLYCQSKCNTFDCDCPRRFDLFS